MSRDLEKYIEEHSFCSELIFRDWKEFLDVLFANGSGVSAILWWEHCRIDKQEESLGGGGYKDPHEPGYMFAETQLYEDGFETHGQEDILGYIDSVRAEYPDHDLIPGFYLTSE